SAERPRARLIAGSIPHSNPCAHRGRVSLRKRENASDGPPTRSLQRNATRLSQTKTYVYGRALARPKSRERANGAGDLVVAPADLIVAAAPMDERARSPPANTHRARPMTMAWVWRSIRSSTSQPNTAIESARQCAPARQREP